ncbi:hypothetical protein [Chamaesiphon sp. VAR_69_metabat_338]|uniref:hypothetical protein n=1 Tax=Chamaesiphon sp. VAR_69_metabat_338 TaxID=2964704 RepID=UPI00286DC8E2|nr:hypothetical protein [Chamaesiphon sp. VAR_69_metabat_338]
MIEMQIAERTFQMWDYHSSHSQLLLRSPKRPGITTNIDIKFFGVAYLNIPTIIRGCAIGEATAAEIEQIDSLLPNRADVNRVFIISSAGNRYPIVAVNYKISENTLDIFQTILDRYDA